MTKRFLIKGDIHGEAVESFSYKKHPELKKLDNTDVILIVGDCGIPFGINHPAYETKWKKKDLYELNYLNSRPEQYIFLRGNHDDCDAIKQMPIVSKYGGFVRQMFFDGKTFDNIVYIDTPQVLDICGMTCLCIPGAKSHDRQYRKNHVSWWEDEDIDCAKLYNLLTTNGNSSKDYDYIFSHDCPSIFVDGDPYCMAATEGEKMLDTIRRTMSFKQWYHGHMHIDYDYPKCLDERIHCIYRNIVELGEE